MSRIDRFLLTGWMTKNLFFYAQICILSATHQMVEKARRYCGCFSLLSNKNMDAIQALELYRGKDPIEKCFGDIKERLNLHASWFHQKPF
jgi:hypothetical protein